MEGARRGCSQGNKGAGRERVAAKGRKGAGISAKGGGEGAARVRGEEEAPSWPTNWPAQHGLSYLGPEAQDPKPHRKLKF